MVWALSSLGSGEWIYFWPGWMLIPLVQGLIGRAASRKRWGRAGARAGWCTAWAER
ncbi:hypothetical protein Asp14428_38330 [Actinoplanes sp. NBRC 14428]|nr:hypothetical protein Asp14428_38330 [Actinoplanes sp. NBRC 14428]